MEDLFFVTRMLHMFYHHAKKVMILDLCIPGFRFRPLCNFQEFLYQGSNFCTVAEKVFVYFYLFMVYLMTLSVDDYVTLIFEKINCILHYRNSQVV